MSRICGGSAGILALQKEINELKEELQTLKENVKFGNGTRVYSIEELKNFLFKNKDTITSVIYMSAQLSREFFGTKLINSSTKWIVKAVYSVDVKYYVYDFIGGGIQQVLTSRYDPVKGTNTIKPCTMGESQVITIP